MCWKYYFRLLLIRIKHVFDAIFEQFYTVSSILYFFIPKKCQNLFYFGMHVIVCMQQMYNTVLIQSHYYYKFYSSRDMLFCSFKCYQIVPPLVFVIKYQINIISAVTHFYNDPFG